MALSMSQRACPLIQTPLGSSASPFDITDIATDWTEAARQEQGPEMGVRRHQRCHRFVPLFRSWASTRTPAQSSSTRSFYAGGNRRHSRSPGPGPGTRTTVPTWSRRTGTSSARPPATTAAKTADQQTCAAAKTRRERPASAKVSKNTIRQPPPAHRGRHRAPSAPPNKASKHGRPSGQKSNDSTKQPRRAS
ncbi:hypothetical protein RKD54_004638 [Pseudarthrobacter sp. SLBN-100]